MRAALILGALLAAAAQAAAPARDYGVLLLAESGGRGWNAELDKLRKPYLGKRPFEIVQGAADARQLQKALASVERANARKIAAIPLRLFSASGELDGARYALGLREKPADALLASMKDGRAPSRASLERTKTKLPVSMGPALDDAQETAEILTDRTKELGRDATRETVLLVARGGPNEDEDLRRGAVLAQVAAKLRERSGLASAHAFVLAESPKERAEKSREALRKLAKQLARERTLLVIPYALTDDGLAKTLQKSLDGVFFKMNGKALAPHPALARWLEKSVQSARDWSNQREFVKPYEPPRASMRKEKP